MEQDSSSGTFIPLSEPEQRYYSGLHGVCQADISGKLSSGKVAELFKASQLSPECLHKVTEVCGAKRLGYFGTPQFFVALKLLAAAQSGLPVHLDSVTANLPLPRFVGLKSEAEPHSSSLEPQGAPGAVAWTPAEGSSFRPIEAAGDNKEAWSPAPSPSGSPPRSPLNYHSYQAYSHRTGTDTQSAYESKAPSSRQPEPLYSQPSLEHPATARAPSPEQQGAVEQCEDDPWRITEEQLDYYTNQFKSLQPDLGALILGTIAKNFFTKSKLPIPELSHIWELSDVDRDGALTFPEFCTAFHLIVARKNGYPLPQQLPASLQGGHGQEDSQSAEPLIVFEHPALRHGHMDGSIVERLQPGLATTQPQLREESCTQDEGGKRGKTSQDKRSMQLAFPPRTEPQPDLDPQMRTKTRPRSYSSTSIEDAMKKAEEPPTPPPRPQKTHSRASSLDLNKLFQQGAPGGKSSWLPPPPALPPRPTTTQASHFTPAPPENTPQSKGQQPNFATFSPFREEEESGVKAEGRGLRSRFGRSTEDLMNASKQEGTGVCQAPQKPLRRKFHPDSQNPESAPPAALPLAAKPAQKLLSKQKREIQMAIRKNKESNAVLTRLNSELQQQLKVVHQDRLTLEAHLEVLRPQATT